MSADPGDAPAIFPGSAGAASIVELLDRLLVELRGHGPAAVRDALCGGGWRTGRDLSGIPAAVLERTERALAAACASLTGPDASVDAAEQAILLVRSHFLPGG